MNLDKRTKRLSDESLTSYKYRICKNKDLYDLSWDGVRDVLNEETGDDFSQDKYRKWFYAFDAGVEYTAKNNSDVDDLVFELEQKKKEFEIAKIQYQDQKREYKKYLRHEGRLDHLLKELLNSFIDDMNAKKPLEWYNRQLPNGNPESAGVLLLSDIHKEMVTDNHWNKYNEEIFYSRLNQVTNECIEYKNKHGLSELHIFELGDLIEGVIHRLTRIEETETATKATQKVAEAIAEMLSVLANEYSTIKYRSVRGNHDRTSSRKDESVSTESFHDFVDWYLQARLQNFENIQILDNEIDDEIIVADILGNTYFGVHGHLDSLSSVISDLTLMTKTIPTAVFSAHIHHNYEKETHGIDLITNGGFAGTNGYAKDHRKTAKAHQKFIILDKKGRKTTEYIRF